jgi:hypothetical protein
MILRGTTPRRLSWQGGLMMLGLAGVMLPLSPIAAQEEEKDTPQATVTTEAGPATPTLTGDNAGRILHLGIQQDIWPPDSIPTLLGEITIQEATGAQAEHGEKTEVPAAKDGHVVTVEEFKKLRSDLSALQMARIEAEAELRVALENLKKIQAKIAQTDEPTTDETDAARAAASTVEKLKLDLELHRRAEAKTRTNLEALVKLQRRIGYQRMNAPKVKKARAEVTDAQQRLHQAIIRAAEAEALLQPDPAEFTTTGPVNRKDKDGSSAASADAVSNPAPKVSPTIELGPDGRVAGSWRVEKSSTTESMVLYNKDGTITMFVVVEGKAGSKPKIQIRTLVRTDGKQAGSAKASDETNDFLKEYYDGLFKSHEASRLVPGDGEPNILSPEEQSLLEQEAEARKLLEEASRMVRKKSSDPALKHHRARLAEIQAKLQAIQAPKPDTDQRINALEEKLNDVLDELKRLQKDEER